MKVAIEGDFEIRKWPSGNQTIRITRRPYVVVTITKNKRCLNRWELTTNFSNDLIRGSRDKCLHEAKILLFAHDMLQKDSSVKITGEAENEQLRIFDEEVYSCQ